MRTNLNGLAVGLAFTLAAGLAEAQEAPPEDIPPIAVHRLEVRPYAGWAFWPQSTTAAFVGADAMFRTGRGVSIGLDGALYAPFDAGAGAAPAYPLNETQWSVDADVAFHVVTARRPPGDEAGAFELYLLGGVGMVATRPIAVADPVHRSFDANILAELSPGIGTRIFASRLLAVTLEARDLMYFERIENRLVTAPPQNPAIWYGPSTHFTNAVQLRLGASFFVGP